MTASFIYLLFKISNSPLMQKCKIIARQKCKIDTLCDVSYQFERRVKRRNSTFRKKMHRLKLNWL